MHPFHAPAAVTALLALSPLLAQAADGDSAFAVRGSISAGSAWRTAERDANLIQRTNGSAAGIPANAPHGRNQDDGNLNFDKGDTLSRVVKGFLHLAYRHDTLSAALGAKAWYDDALLHDGRDWGNGPAGYDAGRALSDHGFSRRGSFSGVALMEAWVAGTFSPAGLPLQVRVGNQYLDWGGRMSIGGGLSALQPVDLPAMRRPGATPDETRVPVTALSARLDASDSTRLEAFYQLLWRPTELDGCGTYFATADYVAPGCNRVMVGDTVSDPASVTGGRFLKRSATPDVANTGQFGLAGFFKLPSLSSELGVYAAQYHSRTPIASPIRSARVGGAPFLPGDADGLNAGYLTEYPEDIRVYGLTWAAKQLNCSIKWTADRSEAFLSDAHGRDHVSHAEMAMDKDGKFLAMRVHTDANLGAYLSTFSTAVPTILYATLLAGQYTCPQIYVEVDAWFTNTAPVDAYRGAGRPEATYLLERLVSRCGWDLGLSQDEIRKRNFISQWPYQTPVALQYDVGDYRACMDKAEKLADVAGFAARRQASEAKGLKRGMGYSSYIEACGIAPSNIAGALGARAGLWAFRGWVQAAAGDGQRAPARLPT